MDYYTLVTALPELPPLAKCKALPISRIALDKRLSMLSEADQQQLHQAETLYHQSTDFDHGLPDQSRIQQWQLGLAAIASDTLRERIQLKLEWQSLLAALRYRQHSRLPPEQFHGLGRWTQRIRRHWHEPLFALEHALPLLAELQPLLQQQQSAALERHLADWLWRDLLFTERSHAFAFEAVACFVLRWGLAENHLNSNADQAQQTFEQLTEQLLAMPAITDAIATAFEDPAR